MSSRTFIADIYRDRSNRGTYDELRVYFFFKCYSLPRRGIPLVMSWVSQTSHPMSWCVCLRYHIVSELVSARLIVASITFECECANRPVINCKIIIVDFWLLVMGTPIGLLDQFALSAACDKLVISNPSIWGMVLRRCALHSTTLPSLRVWTLVRAVLPSLCLPISKIFYFYSFPFPLRYICVFPFPVEPLGLVRIICRLLYSLLCFTLIYLSLSLLLLLLLWDVTHANEVE
jgi:hypothetical protein